MKKKVPGLVWYMVIAVYMLLPIDLVPDAVPLLGQLDDLLVVLVGIRRIVALRQKIG